MLRVGVTWLALACLPAQSTGNDTPPLDAEPRALAFLEREVPRWSTGNRCYSCHNNGDGARALYMAVRLKRRVNPAALADTTAWLARPGAWQDNGGDPAASDKALAALQFAAAAAAAKQAGMAGEGAAVLKAAGIVAAAQQPDGSWRLEGPDTIGSPATWGYTLATVMARDTLEAVDGSLFAEPIGKADRWLRGRTASRVFDTAAALAGLAAAGDPQDDRLRAEWLELIRRSEAPGGGWGPYAASRPETFDTAIVLIALSRLPDKAGADDLISRGRAWLIAEQLPDGSWPETTRPAGGVSYAQRMSTTAWAAQALLVSSDRRRKHATH